jgi:butyrate kinase
MKKRLILAINPGSTSTKFALFEEEKIIFEKTLRHSSEELSGFREIADQFHFRKDLIVKELKERNVNHISAIMGRGGLIKPIESGVYKVNELMKEDLKKGLLGQHASNLGGLIADDLASSFPGSVAYIVDPVVVDELVPEARISGLPEIERISIFHALNQKAVARMYAASVGKKYEDINLIIAHMGGGISVGAHRKGRVIDVNNALNGDGPFSPERSGGLPAGQLVDLCFSQKYSQAEIKSLLTGKGGLVAYLGTNNFQDVCKSAESSDKQALLLIDALTWQVTKEIGAMSTTLNGSVDAIILTGGLAHQEMLVNKIKAKVE